MAELGELYWTLAVEDNVSKELKTIQDALKGTNNQLVSLSDYLDEGLNVSSLDEMGKSSEQLSNQMKSLEQIWSKLSFEDKFNGESYSADAQKIVDSYRKIMDSAKDKGKTLQGIIKEEITAQEKLIKAQEKAQAVSERERATSRKSDMVAALREQERATQEAEKQRAKRVDILRVLRQEETTITAIRQKLALMTQIQDKSKLDSKQFENARKEIERLNGVLGQYQATSRTATAVNNQFATSAGNVARESNKQSLVVSELLTTLRNFAGFYFARDAVKQLAEVTGQFELQRVSLQAITQNATEANKVFAQFQTLAVKSPYQFTEIIAGAKQLAAFNVPLKDLYSTTKIITDLSAGLGVDMGRIILAYGQVQAASVLRGQELRQFTEAGIPLVQKLADKFTLLEGRVVSTGEVFDKISTRMVPFEMIKEIFTDLTSEGGMFFNMQEKQAETLYGKISNLKDAYQLMLNDIGTANSGILSTAVDIPRILMSNWKEVSNILWGVVAAYGTFRAAQMLNVAMIGTENKALIGSIMANKLKTAEMAIQATTYRALSFEEVRAVATKRTLTAADIQQSVTSGKITNDMIMRLFLTKKLSAEQAMLLVTTKALDIAQLRALASATGWARTKILLGMATKSLIGSLQTLWTTIIANPLTWIIGIIGAVAYAWSNHNEAVKKAAESTARLAESAKGSFTEISKAMRDFKRESENLSFTVQIAQLEKMAESMGDTGTVIIQNSKGITDQAERVKYLSENIEQAKNGFLFAANNAEALQSALSATKEGWFGDNLYESAEKFGTSLDTISKKLSGEGFSSKDITAFAEELIKAGEGTDEFRNSLSKAIKEGKSTSSIFMMLYENINTTTLKSYALKSGLGSMFGDAFLSSMSGARVKLNEFKGDAEKFAEFLKKGMFKDVDFTKPLTAETIAAISAMTDEMLKGAENLSQEMKDKLKFEVQFQFNFPTIKEVQPVLSDFTKRVNQQILNLAPRGITPSFIDTKILKKDVESFSELLSQAKDDRDLAKKQLEEKINAPSLFSPEDIAAAKQALLDREAYYKLLGGQDKITEKASKTQKEQYEEELILIKKVYSDYKDLRKYMGDEAAQAKIKELYEGLLPEVDMAFSPEQFIEALDRMSKKFAGIKAKKAVIGVEVDINAEKLDNLTKDIKNALDKAAKEVERHKEQFDIYKNLIAKGFEEGRAQTLAFGVEFKVQEGGYNIGQYLADNLAQSLSVTIPNLKLDFSVDTSFIDQIGEAYSKLGDDERKKVEALEKERFEMKKNYFMQYVNLVTKESPEGMGLQFDMTNVFAKYKEELVKLEDVARQAMSSDQYKKGKEPGASEEDKAEAERLDRNIRLAKDANSKIAIDKAKKLGGVYLQEKMEIAGLGEIYKNMSSASASSIKSMLEVVRTSSDELLSGVQSRVEGLGVGEFSEMFRGVFDADNLTVYTEELDKVIVNLNAINPDPLGKTAPTAEMVQKMLQFANAQRSVALNSKQVGVELQSIKTDNILKSYKVLGDNVKKVIDSVQGLGEAFGIEFDDISKSAISLASTIAGSANDVIDTISSTAKSSSKGIEATGEVAKESMTSVEKASVILAIISAALQVATAIANLFASSAKKKNENIINNAESQVKRLEYAYNDLGRAVDDAFGSQKFDLQSKQITNLQAQQAALAKQLKTEGKKGGLSAEEADEIRRRMVELGQQQEDIIKGIKDSIIGTSKDLAETLGNALIDAFLSGEDAAGAWAKSVDDIIAEMVRNMIIAKLVAKEVDKIVNDFFDKIITPPEAFNQANYEKALSEAQRKAFKEGSFNMFDKGSIKKFNDEFQKKYLNSLNQGGLVDIDKIIESSKELGTGLKDLGAGLAPAIEAIYKELGDLGVSTSKGTAEGIKSITEDTANRLAGYMNSIRAEMIVQSGYMVSMMGSLNLISNTASSQLSVLNSQLAHLNAMRVVLDSVYDPAKRALRVN